MSRYVPVDRSPLAFYGIIYPLVLLFLCGALVVYGAAAGEWLDLESAPHPGIILTKHLIHGFLALGIAYISYLWGYRNFFEMRHLIAFLILLGLICVFVPGLGKRANGANRWIGLSWFGLQPSEFAKVCLPLILFHSLLKDPSMRFRTFAKKLIPCSLAVVLIWKEPDHGTALILAVLLITAVFLAGIRMRYWVAPLLVLAIIGGVAAWQTPYISARLAVYFDPSSDLLGVGHQAHQAKIAIGSGGLFGKGLGESWQRVRYLPEAQNDYIAAIFAEEMGWIGISLMILLYCVFACSAFSLAMSSSEYLCAGLCSIIGTSLILQAFLNLGVVSGLLPSTGLNLPVFSQGGSSLLANGMAVGLLLSSGRSSE